MNNDIIYMAEKAETLADYKRLQLLVDAKVITTERASVEEDRVVIARTLAANGGVFPRKHKLEIPAGSYTYVGVSRFPLLVLLGMVIKHRWAHWRRGEGWID